MTDQVDKDIYGMKRDLYDLVSKQAEQQPIANRPDLAAVLDFTKALWLFLSDWPDNPLRDQVAGIDQYAGQVGDDVEALTARVALVEQSAYQPGTDRGPKVVAEPSIPLMGPEYAESMEWIDPPMFVFMPYGLGVDAHKPTGENIVVKLASDDPPPCPAPVDPKRQPGRLTDKQSVVEYLEKQGGRGSVTGQIAKACWIKSGTVSARLTDLIQAGQVVQRDQDGRKFYWLTAYAPPVDAAPVEPPTAQPQPQEVEPAEEPVAEEAIPTPDEALDRDILYEIRSRADMRLSSRLGQLADSLAEPEKKIQKRLSILEADGRIKQRTPGAYVLA